MTRTAGWRFWAVAALVTVAVAAGLSALATDEPDGLERVARDEGFADTADEHDLAGSPLAGYGVDGLDDGHGSVALAGVAGVAVTVAVAGGALWLLRRRTPAEVGGMGSPAGARDAPNPDREGRPAEVGPMGGPAGARGAPNPERG